MGLFKQMHVEYVAFCTKLLSFLTQEGSRWYPGQVIVTQINFGELSEAFKGRITNVEDIVSAEFHMCHHG